MKRHQHDEAKRMRREDGESINVIAKKLGVSKGSVSSWCADIKLSKEQELKLTMRNPVYIGQFAGAKSNKEKALSLRKQYQEKGRQLSKKFINDSEFAIGCALYWGEGNKGRAEIGVSNLDSDLIIKVKNWLIRYFDCDINKFKIRITAYLNNGLNSEEINNFWIEKLGLNKNSIHKFIAREKYYSGLNKTKNYSPYGMCLLRYCSVEKMQMIFGAMQETMKIKKQNWLL